MLGIILLSHGNFAAELLRATEMIVGPQGNVYALALNPEDNPQALAGEIKAYAGRADTGDGVLILADLLGGSPCNIAASLAKEGIPVITGMNMPMLIELFGIRDAGYPDVAEKIIEVGRQGINDLRKFLKDG
jgi:PTS system mannose-specific IIA component